MQVRQHADHTELLIRGPVRLGEVPELLTHAREVSALGLPVTIDFTEAGHLHTAAWQVLMALERDVCAAGRSFQATNVPDSTRAMFEFLELTQWLQVREGQH